MKRRPRLPLASVWPPFFFSKDIPREAYNEWPQRQTYRPRPIPQRRHIYFSQSVYEDYLGVHLSEMLILLGEVDDLKNGEQRQYIGSFQAGPEGNEEGVGW